MSCTCMFEHVHVQIVGLGEGQAAHRAQMRLWKLEALVAILDVRSQLTVGAKSPRALITVEILDPRMDHLK